MYGNRDMDRVSAADQAQIDRLAQIQTIDGVFKLTGALHFLPVQSLHQVADFQAGPRGGTIRFDIADNDAPVLRQAQPLGQERRDALHDHADVAAVHVPVLEDLLVNVAYGSAGHGEADALASA